MSMHQRLNGRTRGFVVLAAALLMVPAAGAQQTERYDMRVRDHFFAGFQGDADALRRGMAMVAEALEADPDHPQALVWQATGWQYKSSVAFQQGDWTAGMDLFDRSVAQFERAVSLSPDDVGVRIPRATTYASVAKYVTHAPTRRMLQETALGDFTRVLELQGPYFEHLSTHARGELFGGLSDTLRQLGRRDEARVFLLRMVSELPNTPYAAMAGRQLDAPEESVQVTCLGCHSR